MNLLGEISRKGRRGYRFPQADVPSLAPAPALEARYLREGEGPDLPEVSEADVVRYFTNLSHRNYAVDLGFYPLGSCTMKYNPKVNEDASELAGFKRLHPLQPESSLQGILELMHGLLKMLCEITGMSWGTLHPFAGAHGEFTGMKIFRACFDERKEGERRRILVPDSSHGTNPASAHLAGFEVKEIPSSAEGLVSLQSLAPYLDRRLAGIMLTNPNTLGLFEREILAIARAVHDAGGLLYYDGANLNAIMGKARPGDMGFDVVHLNLHKTFSTPHGGGGPGAGPVLVTKALAPYLPIPDVVRVEAAPNYRFDWDRPRSIGRVSGFYGNAAIMVRAYAYLLAMGSEGLERASELAVLNANYLKEKLKAIFHLPHDTLCKHEFVLSARLLKEATGVSALDVAKRLLDYGFHAPTIYFPLIVPEALMIEPVETEARETLDAFAEAMGRIVEEARSDPQRVKQAPLTTPVGRIDDVQAARRPILRWKPGA